MHSKLHILSFSTSFSVPVTLKAKIEISRDGHIVGLDSTKIWFTLELFLLYKYPGTT